MVVVVPVRVVESSEEGVSCRLGSQPDGEAAVVLVPAECIASRSEAEGSDLAVLVLREDRVPGWLRSLLGID